MHPISWNIFYIDTISIIPRLLQHRVRPIDLNGPVAHLIKHGQIKFISRKSGSRQVFWTIAELINDFKYRKIAHLPGAPMYESEVTLQASTPAGVNPHMTNLEDLVHHI